jgi:hypothetical protein
MGGVKGARHEPWQFFIFRFTADDGKHAVSVGATSRGHAVELVTNMYSGVHKLRIEEKQIDAA